MCSQNISAQENWKREIRDDEQWIRHFDTRQLNWHIDVPFNFSAGATDTNNIWRKLLEVLDGKLAGKYAYSALLSIEKAKPVSTSASRTCTESMIALVNTCGAPTPADSPAFDDF